MRKSIGTRVYVMIAILLIAMTGYSCLTYFGLNESKTIIADFSETYTQLQIENETVTKNVAELRMHGNIIVLSDDESKATSSANAVQGLIDEINTSMQTMNGLVGAIDDKEMMELLEKYGQKAELLQNTISNISTLYLSGDTTGAAAINNRMSAMATNLEADQEAFTALLNERIVSEAKYGIDSIAYLQSITVIISVIIMIIEVLIIVMVRNSVVKPAKEATKHLKTIIDGIEQGEGNLTDRIPVKSIDEIGQLASGINAFIEQLQGIMIKLRSGSEGMNMQVASINDSIVTSEGSASDVSATMEQMSASMEEISATLDHITAGSNSMLEFAREMRGMAEGGTGFVGDIKEKAEAVRLEAVESKNNTVSMIETNKKAMEIAIENSRSVEKINDLTNEILSISSQTNLLSLNASIEAARAGEAGRGFAVVADEIRALADNSKNTANNIQQISVMVTQAVEELAGNANEMLAFIDTTILADYDKLVDVSTQYHDDADSIDTMMGNFKEKSENLENTISDINEGILGINSAIEESSLGVTMVADNTSQLVEMLSNIKADAESNRVISDELSSEVQMFKHI